MNALEDEYHFLPVCPKYMYREIRLKYLKPYYCHWPNMTKFQNIMSSDKLSTIHSLSKFIYFSTQSGVKHQPIIGGVWALDIFGIPCAGSSVVRAFHSRNTHSRPLWGEPGQMFTHTFLFILQLLIFVILSAASMAIPAIRNGGPSSSSPPSRYILCGGRAELSVAFCIVLFRKSNSGVITS